MEPKNDDDLEWSDNEDDDHTNNENYWKVRGVPAGRHYHHHHHHHLIIISSSSLLSLSSSKLHEGLTQTLRRLI